MVALVVDAKMGQLPRFEVEKLEGEIEVTYYAKTEDGLVKRTDMEPAGFMVYFPRGHSVRIRTEKELRRLGFHRIPGIAMMEEGEQTDDIDPDEETGGPISLKRIVAQTTQPPRRTARGPKE